MLFGKNPECMGSFQVHIRYLLVLWVEQTPQQSCLLIRKMKSHTIISDVLL